MSTRSSKQMSSELTKILESTAQPAFNILCEIFVTDPVTAEEVKVTVQFIDEMSIEQDFIDTYTDYIYARCLVTPKDFMWLVDNYKELKCHLRISYPTKDTKNKSGGDKTIELIQRVFIKNFRDAAHYLSSNEIKMGQESTLVPIELELTDLYLYEMRKRQINFMTYQSTMDSVIKYAAKLLGVKQIAICPPDNKRVYQHLNIPPMLDISNLFTYLQDAPNNGVYYNGCCHYFSNGILYVYPQYDVEPNNVFQTTHIYKASGADLTGLEVYHIRDEKSGDISFICNTPIRTNHEILAALENQGSGLILAKMDRILSDWHTVKGTNLVELKTGNVFNFTAGDRNYGISNGAISGRFKRSFNNEFSAASVIAKSRLVRMALDWHHALPMSIYPGQRIMYHYDKLLEDPKSPSKEVMYKFESKKAICEKVIYSIRRAVQRDKVTYTCTGTLQLAASLEVQ